MIYHDISLYHIILNQFKPYYISTMVHLTIMSFYAFHHSQLSYHESTILKYHQL